MENEVKELAESFICGNLNYVKNEIGNNVKLALKVSWQLLDYDKEHYHFFLKIMNE